MLFRFTSYLNFLFKSTNEHGVHSPFVFNFVTKCLYSKKRLHKNKSFNVVLKSIAYFNYKHIKIENHRELKNTVLQNFPTDDLDSSLLDMWYSTSMDVHRFKKILSDGRLHNDSMVVVGNIYENKSKYEAWELLTKLPEISVSIDMYHCGALFIRQEQVKEHFTIRI